MSYQPQTEAATSRFLNVDRKRVKRCASILMTADKATKPLSCCMVPARVLLAGRTSADDRSAGRGGLSGDPTGLSGLGQERFDR